MKDKLIGLTIGTAIVVAALAIFGFKGTSQNGNIGRFQLHTTGSVNRNDGTTPYSKTYLVDTATGDVWHESSNSWVAIKRPRTSED
jgi:hypothetical protein